jgi:hypothetical protein
MKYILILSILAALLGGCVAGYGDNRDGYSRERDYNRDDGNYRDRDDNRRFCPPGQAVVFSRRSTCRPVLNVAVGELNASEKR